MTVINSGTVTTTAKFTVGAGPQKSTTPNGEEECFDPKWEGDVLVMNPDHGPSLKRYVEGAEMVIELELKGTTVTRRFSKEGVDPEVRAIYKKVFADMRGDRAKITAALGLKDTKAEDFSNEATFLKKFCGD